MNRRLLHRLAALAAAPVLALAGALPAAELTTGDFERAPAYKPAEAEQVKNLALEWLAQLGAGDDLRRQAEALWPQGEPAERVDLLERLAATLALADARIGELAALCAGPSPHLAPVPPACLADEKLPPPLRNNLRLLYGRWLARERFYEEALAQLEGLGPGDVLEPAALLFYQGVCHHRLLQKEPGLKALQQLLDDVQGGPLRYVSVAGLMQADLEGLETDSLDEISRMMSDIDRRLDLGRPGPKTRKVEDDVIAKLDKLIEEMEKQQQQQQAAAGGGTLQPTQPAQDSVPMQGKGPGQTTKRNIGSQAGWGDLPPKERQEALQQIGKDFPSHYREVIEQYFRKIASDTEE